MCERGSRLLMLNAAEGRMRTNMRKSCREAGQPSAVYTESFPGQGCAHMHASAERNRQANPSSTFD